MQCKRCQKRIWRNLTESSKEPVGINKNGKPVAIMVSASEYEEF
jgi:PHD/YefM family antitoxin component YafN of YafNO toxin-antitoxin module